MFRSGLLLVALVSIFGNAQASRADDAAPQEEMAPPPPQGETESDEDYRKRLDELGYPNPLPPPAPLPEPEAPAPEPDLEDPANFPEPEQLPVYPPLGHDCDQLRDAKDQIKMQLDATESYILELEEDKRETRKRLFAAYAAAGDESQTNEIAYLESHFKFLQDTIAALDPEADALTRNLEAAQAEYDKWCVVNL